MSAFSDRIETYRKENNITEIMVPSEIIQKMVNSKFSGIAFGVNPMNSKLNEVYMDWEEDWLMVLLLQILIPFQKMK